MPDKPDLSELTAAVQRVRQTYARDLRRPTVRRHEYGVHDGHLNQDEPLGVEPVAWTQTVVPPNEARLHGNSLDVHKS